MIYGSGKFPLYEAGGGDVVAAFANPGSRKAAAAAIATTASRGMDTLGEDTAGKLRRAQKDLGRFGGSKRNVSALGKRALDQLGRRSSRCHPAHAARSPDVDRCSRVPLGRPTVTVPARGPRMVADCPSGWFGTGVSCRVGLTAAE
jgi:hypothetical protein